AIDTFKKVLGLDATNGLAYQNLASMVLREALATPEPGRRSRLQEAEAFARQALDVDPSLPDAFTTLGVVLSTSGRKADAITSWKRALVLHAPAFNACHNLSVA